MKCRTANGQTTHNDDVYKITYDAVCAETRKRSGDKTTRRADRVSTTIQNETCSFWPTDVFGQKGRLHMRIAHLVPASPKSACSYWFVADFLFGADSNREWIETSRLIHGSSAGEAHPKKKEG
mmetsp:Transcript_7948/g.19780  ORF Transcript_7948/g.19780 Transcript_7948/m.19780 type:complete len:123 (+) Transcript_7948:694-1062(+)